MKIGMHPHTRLRTLLTQQVSGLQTCCVVIMMDDEHQMLSGNLSILCMSYPTLHIALRSRSSHSC